MHADRSRRRPADQIIATIVVIVHSYTPLMLKNNSIFKSDPICTICTMEPEFNDGDIIIISPTAKAVTGDYVVAKNDEEEATFKQYKRFDNTRVLHPLNPKYPDIVLNKDLEYRIVGVVMEKKKRYK